MPKQLAMDNLQASLLNRERHEYERFVKESRLARFQPEPLRLDVSRPGKMAWESCMSHSSGCLQDGSCQLPAMAPACASIARARCSTLGLEVSCDTLRFTSGCEKYPVYDRHMYLQAGRARWEEHHTSHCSAAGACGMEATSSLLWL